MLADRVRMTTFKDSLFIPEGYVLATDDDFSGTTNGSFRYIGSDLKIVVPNRIKGVAVTRYDSMFSGSSVIGVVSYNKNVTSMYYMFYNSKATTLDLSSFDTSNVTDMRGMFDSSKATTLDLSSFDTSNVTNMGSMFYNSSATTLDLSSFDTSNVTDMSYMFSNSSVTTLDLSSFDTSNVTNMNNMFNGCSATIGYARTQADADRFNNSSNKPSTLVFVVK